ncbi:MAG: BolA/IbaG family iron-sulfur metabolism protein [Candidatus Omnitrophica bacterium]|nr:BolA/IbaG family iron-sulfur metabolism protein [Candidatus Omnitrophota bacterium]
MTVDELQKTIASLVPQSTVYVLDPMRDGQHLEAIVISPVFEGMMLIKQHQMIMKPLKEVLLHSVHALGLKTFTPAKWQEVKNDYNL